MAPRAALTEQNLPDQQHKVFIVTGGSSGVGRQLAQILYAANAKVYIAARNESKTRSTISSITKAVPLSKGQLFFLYLDLNDLTTIKSSVEHFLSKENKLHALWNNAGIMVPPQGSTTKQNFELQLGTNNVAPFLFTKLLTPLLHQTAKISEPGEVRVVWVSSSASKRFASKGGVDMNNLDYKKDVSAWNKYGNSKAGNILHASEYAKRHGKDGIISVSVDPGNLNTDLYQHVPGWQRFIMNYALHDPIEGAYSELYAGLSLDITCRNNGTFTEYPGKIASPRADILESTLSKADGGSGIAEAFWDWTERQVAPYA